MRGVCLTPRERNQVLRCVNPDRPAPVQHTEKAMALMIIAMLVVPAMDAIAKWLSSSISAGQVVWCRFAFQTLLLFPFFLATRGQFVLRDMPIHAMRGGLMVFGTVVFFTALKHLPIADAIAIFFVEPLILTLMAALFLGEKIGWRRLTAVVVGFLGALIVIRPNFEVFGWPAMLPLVSAMTFSVYLIITRTLSQRENPIRMQFYSGVFGSVSQPSSLRSGLRSSGRCSLRRGRPVSSGVCCSLWGRFPPCVICWSFMRSSEPPPVCWPRFNTSRSLGRPCWGCSSSATFLTS